MTIVTEVHARIGTGETEVEEGTGARDSFKSVY